jgi:signal transduction histidine kinase/ActR/RegA family two-component response regulator
MRFDPLLEERVLVLAPRGRDAQVISQVLMNAGLVCTVCDNHKALLQDLEAGAGTALIAEEALLEVDLMPLADWLSRQASWSDFPFVLLTAKESLRRMPAARALLGSLSNVILLERPLNAETLRRATASALRARKRQYQARSDLQVRIRAEERLHIALQAGRLGSWELDLSDWTLTASDTCKANFGRAPDTSFTYEDQLAAIHPDDRAHARSTINMAIAALSDFEIEYRVIWPDGSLHWVLVQGRTSGDALGRALTMTGVSQDITDRHEANRRLHASQEALRHLNETLESRIAERTAELAQANDRLMREITERERTQLALVQAQKMEAVGHLTGGIAHDFNNLLNVILGNVELIDIYSTDERVKRLAAIARKSTERGAKLTGQLLAFSRSQTLDLKPVDLALVMDSVQDLLASSLGAEIEAHFELAEQLPPALADLNQVELAILNLALNARDAMPRGGTLTFRTSLQTAAPQPLPEGQYAVISVSDTGGGINPDIIGKVFDPFFTTKALGKGTGLGLSQVYGIARQSGGTARIESRMGEGTTVEIWLPLADAEDISAAVDAGTVDQDAAGAQAKILVVEDDPEVREFIVEYLKMLGHEVVQADNGAAGLALLASMRVDLMITDFLMPGMDGAQLMAKASALYPHLPIIIATGYADMHAIEEVIGANAVLRKPFHMNDLAHCVRRALAR